MSPYINSATIKPRRTAVNIKHSASANASDGTIIIYKTVARM